MSTAICRAHGDSNRRLAIELLLRAWPILCSGLLGVLDASVNVMWVGREIGGAAVAALSNANLLWSLLFAAAFGLSMAGAVRVARSLGQKNIQGAKSTFGAMISLSAVVSVVCVLPMEIWARPLLICLGTPAVSLAQAIIYLRILLAAVPFGYLYAAAVAALQAAGDSKAGLYFSLVSVAIDAVLNPSLINGIGPVPPMGISGSASATVASQAVGVICIGYYVSRSGRSLRFRGKDIALLRFSWSSAAGLLRDGCPTAILFLWMTIEEMVMISFVNRFGADVTAAYGVIIQVWSYVTMPANALSVAITSMVAEAIGAVRWDRARTLAGLGLIYGAIISVALVCLAEIWGMRGYRLFLPSDPRSFAVASEINREATWSLIFVSEYTVWIGVLRGTGSVWAPLVISAAVLAMRVPVTTTLLGYWHTHAIWWSFPASAVTTCGLAMLHCRFRFRAQLHMGANASTSPAKT